MKTLISIIIFLLSGICFSQTKVDPPAVKMDLITWVQFHPLDSIVENQVGTLYIKVKNYNVFKPATSNQYYINVATSNGIISKKYLGYKLKGVHRFEGNDIFFSKDTTQAWIWTVDRYGQIYKMNLPKIFAEYERKKIQP